MSLHHEVAFDREICGHLSPHGWLYEEGSAARYYRQLALDPPDLIAWLTSWRWSRAARRNGDRLQGYPS